MEKCRKPHKREGFKGLVYRPGCSGKPVKPPYGACLLPAAGRFTGWSLAIRSKACLLTVKFVELGHGGSKEAERDESEPL